MMPKVLLDAGHYGYYNQSPVYPQYYESKQMWKLHLLLKKYLEKYGFEVDTTRAKQEKDLSLRKRGKCAKGYDLFLSLHSDACDEEEVDRATAFYAYDDWNNASELAKKLADAVAECMSVSGKTKTRQSTNGAWDYYTVMFYARKVGCPLYYIIEHSFHTNEAAAKWLVSDSNLDKLAKAEAKVIAEHFGIAEKSIEAVEEVKTVTITLNQLSKGSKGEQVKNLQILLNSKGYSCGSAGADGIFGTNTEKAVVLFQAANGLTADGICGKNTWTKLLT